MKSFGAMSLAEGSDFENLTVASGISFPPDGNVGELFHYTGTAVTSGLYSHNGLGWQLVLVDGESFAARVKAAMPVRYAHFTSSGTIALTNLVAAAVTWVTIQSEPMVVTSGAMQDRLTFTESGLYELTYTLNLLGGNGPYETYLDFNTAIIPRSSCFGTLPNNTTDRVTFTNRVLMQVNTGQEIRLVARRTRGSGVSNIPGVEVSHVIRKMR